MRVGFAESIHSSCTLSVTSIVSIAWSAIGVLHYTVFNTHCEGSTMWRCGLFCSFFWLFGDSVSDINRFIAQSKDLLSTPTCQNVYIDLGTNRGMQLRKLYEPELYPKGDMHKLFNKFFGGESYNKTQVCSFGFEPNRFHADRLQNLSRGYNIMGYPNVIFTETAVGSKHGNLSFFVEPPNSQTHQWGSSIFNYKAGLTEVEVALFHISHFIKTQVISRVLPIPNQPASVLVKMDIEGAEYDVLSNLLQHGTVCGIDGLYIGTVDLFARITISVVIPFLSFILFLAEYHQNQVTGVKPPHDFHQSLVFMVSKFEHCNVDIGLMSDDEYVQGLDLFPLPPGPYNITRR